MDRIELSGSIIAELGAIFTGALERQAETLLGGDLAELETRLQALGRVVLGAVVERVVAVRAAATPVPVCPGCGQGMRCAERARPRQVRGLVGDSTLRRPYYHCPSCQQGQAPLDEALGLGPGGLSPALSRVVCRLGVEGSFGAAETLVDDLLGVRVPAETARRVTERVGAVAEAEQQAAIAGVQRGDAPTAAVGPAPAVLLVTVDGVQAPLRDGWHEVKVSRVGPLGPATTADPATGRTSLALGPCRYGAGLEGAEASWWRTAAAAQAQGLGHGVETVVVLGDGAEWIWAAALRFLGGTRAEVVEVVDLIHVSQYLWAVGSAVFGPGTPAAAAWVSLRCAALRQAGAPPVLVALAALIPPDATAAEAIRVAIGYVTNHRARLDYPHFLARGLPIGSGAVESTCKVLISQRAKQAGMRWGPAGLQAVASLRACHRSGAWEAFWQGQPQRRLARADQRPRLRRGPLPAPATAPPPTPAAPAADPRLAALPAGRHDPPPDPVTSTPRPTTSRPGPRAWRCSPRALPPRPTA